MDWGFGISRCKILYMEWINYKVLLYSIGNYIQYSVKYHNGKESEKEYVYINIYDTHICITITLLYIRNQYIINELHFNKYTNILHIHLRLLIIWLTFIKHSLCTTYFAMCNGKFKKERVMDSAFKKPIIHWKVICEPWGII